MRAARAVLAEPPYDPTAERVLGRALEDPSWTVRAASAGALGSRRVQGAADKLRDLLQDKEQHFEVRRAAATAVANLCDADSLDPLTKAALKLADPLATVEDRAVGESALRGLARLAPKNLESRLKPLLASPMAPAARRALVDAAQSSACTH